MNKKEMEEKIAELEEIVGELTSIVRLVIDGFKQTDNLKLIKEVIEIAKDTHKGMSKNTDFIITVARVLQQMQSKSTTKKREESIYI